MENAIQNNIRNIMVLLNCKSTLQLYMLGFMSVVIIYVVILTIIAYKCPRKFSKKKRLYSEIGYIIGLIAMFFGSFVYELVQSPLWNYIFIWSIVIILDTRIICGLGE